MPARALCLTLCLTSPAHALSSSVFTDAQGTGYRVLKLDPRTQTLELHWKDAGGRPLRSFSALERFLKSQGKTLLGATNAGIFMQNRAPLGLHVQGGQALRPLNRSSGFGNFYLKPNGVFFLTAQGAGILETGQYAARNPRARLATQSGPLLVQNGRIHPAFREGSSNRLIRSGVGVSRSGRVYWVLSEGAVNFHDFARFFRDTLGCPDALFLDGTISRVYLPQDRRFRDQPGGDFAGFLTVVKRQ